MMREHILWVEKYRPTTIAECILPQALKTCFQGIVNDGIVPNLLLSGSPGTGKTTVAKCICRELDLDYIMINASDERNIDTLRTSVKTFASSMSFDNKRKVIILDEADYLNPQSFQPALRSVMEEFAMNCSFILTCNFRNKIIDPLHSRCAIKEFRIEKHEKKELITQLYKRVITILQAEEVKHDKRVLANIIVTYFPDVRRLLNELQMFSKINGEITEGILTKGDISTDKLILALREKNFRQVREWVAENLDLDSERVFRMVYDRLSDELESSSIPSAIILIADYQYKSAFTVDREINLLACLIEIMANCRFK